jgi:hypothetical protein
MCEVNAATATVSVLALTPWDAMTFSITTLSIITFIIITLGIRAFSL